MTDQPHTPTVLDEMRNAFATRHWHRTDDYEEGQRIFDDQIAAIEAAAEQRGAARELRQAALEWSRAGNDANVYAWLHYRADQIANKEGDDE